MTSGIRPYARCHAKSHPFVTSYEGFDYGPNPAYQSVGKMCTSRTPGDSNPWNAPGPKCDFILSLGFALQRANSRMLRCADRR
eukprot:COSAG02_NODE_54264_length_297_cov_0.747475_1_plen_82_part_01